MASECFWFEVDLRREPAEWVGTQRAKSSGMGAPLAASQSAALLARSASGVASGVASAHDLPEDRAEEIAEEELRRWHTIAVEEEAERRAGETTLAVARAIGPAPHPLSPPRRRSTSAAPLPGVPSPLRSVEHPLEGEYVGHYLYHSASLWTKEWSVQAAPWSPPPRRPERPPPPPLPGRPRPPPTRADGPSVRGGTPQLAKAVAEAEAKAEAEAEGEAKTVHDVERPQPSSPMVAAIRAIPGTSKAMAAHRQRRLTFIRPWYAAPSLPPSFHGLPSSFHGLPPSFHGLSSSFHGLPPSFHGLPPSFHGLLPSFHGIQPSFHGLPLPSTAGTPCRGSRRASWAPRWERPASGRRRPCRSGSRGARGATPRTCTTPRRYA